MRERHGGLSGRHAMRVELVSGDWELFDHSLLTSTATIGVADEVTRQGSYWELVSGDWELFDHSLLTSTATIGV